jgi:hypothetical protein
VKEQHEMPVILRPVKPELDLKSDHTQAHIQQCSQALYDVSVPITLP